jgi:uncharacterized membrane protein YebE (DUF533 family)
MSVQSLLEQLLQSGMAKVESAKQSGDLGKYATGAAAGGVLALLLGSRGGRSLTGKALKVGTVAALGTMAWRAYNDWQAQQQGRQAGAPSAAAGAPQARALPAPEAFERLPAAQLEDHSRAMLKAMIAAAKADGHLDERERGLVEAELQRLEADPATRRWMEDELRRPVEPAEVARAALGPTASPQMAAEVYLASLLVVDDTTTMERAYLDELARQLQLAPGLRAELEARARAG